VLDLADIKIKVIATPGHTAGSCCFYVEEAGILVAGDTLFYESVGRCDLPTGSGMTLERSVKEKIFTLPPETVCYPGHGDETSVSHEMKYNPFLV
ncbi:MAG: MBL fold metallo-hydrolase, partial [Lachnospiraceae bacterium]|nr:MBL fold metallo-hydrolase [Lachnospiraceae bacterium]